MKTVKIHMKKYSTLLTISGIQVLTIRYCLTSVRMVIIQNISNNKCCQECGEKGTHVHCWWKCKFVHPLWKIVRRLPKAKNRTAIWSNNSKENTNSKCIQVIGAWIYLWAFYFVPLIYISVYVPVPHSLDDCVFVVETEVKQVDSSSSILISLDCFGYSRYFFISLQIVKLFVLILWKIPLVAWQGLHWIYR